MSSVLKLDMKSRIKTAKEVAEILFQNKFFESALAILQQICIAQEEECGSLHVDVVATKIETIPVLVKLQKITEVTRLYRDYCNYRIQVTEENSVQTGPLTWCKLLSGSFLKWETRYDDALIIFAADLGDKLAKFGSYHSCVQAAYQNYVSCLEPLGKLDEAITILEKHPALRKCSSSNLTSEEFTLSMRIARIRDKQMCSGSAKKLLQKLLNRMKGLLPDNHEAVLAVRLNIALVLSNQRKHTEALALFQEILGIAQRKLSFDHQLIGNITLQFGHALFASGAFEEALEKYEEVYRLNPCERADPKMIEVLKAKFNALEKLGRYRELVQVSQCICTCCLAGFGELHPTTVAEKRKLAYYMQYTGDLQGSASLTEELCHLSLQVYGPDHENTVESNLDLANAFTNTHRPKEGLQLMEKVLVTQSQKHGKRHPVTMKTSYMLGGQIALQGNYEEGLKLMNDYMEYLKSSNPDDNMEKIYGIKQDMAQVLCSKGDFEPAFSLYHEVIEWFSTNKGKTNVHTIMSKKLLAGALQESGEKLKAYEIYNEIHDEIINLLGPDHPTSSICRFVKGVYLYGSEDFADGLKVLKEELAKQCQLHGPTSPNTLAARIPIIECLRKLERYDEALMATNEAIGIRKSFTQDPADRISLKLRFTKGNVLASLKRFEEAGAIFEKLLACHRKYLPRDDKDTMCLLNSLGFNFNHQSKHEDAYRVFKQLYELKAAKYGSDDECTWDCKLLLAWELIEMGKLSEANQIYQEVYKKRRNYFGEDHELTVDVKNESDKLVRILNSKK